MFENITSMPVVETISTPIGFFMSIIYIFVGGIFGIYVVSFIYNVYMGLKMKRKMKHIQNDISGIKLHLNKLEELIVNQNSVSKDLKNNKITLKNSYKSNRKSNNKKSLKQKKV